MTWNHFALSKIFLVHVGGIENKPGTAQVGAISKAQKQQKDLKRSEYSLLRYRKNPKVEQKWRTRGDTLRFFIHSVANQKNWRKGTFGEKIFFWKKVSQCRKNWKAGTLWDFSTSVLSENSKKIEGVTLWGIFFWKKVSQSRKYSKGVEYPLVPLSFLDDVKILLRKLLR